MGEWHLSVVRPQARAPKKREQAGAWTRAPKSAKRRERAWPDEEGRGLEEEGDDEVRASAAASRLKSSRSTIGYFLLRLFRLRRTSIACERASAPIKMMKLRMHRSESRS